MELVTTIPQIHISDLGKSLRELGKGSYMIVPSIHTDCIYTRFPGLIDIGRIVIYGNDVERAEVCKTTHAYGYQIHVIGLNGHAINNYAINHLHTPSKFHNSGWGFGRGYVTSSDDHLIITEPSIGSGAIMTIKITSILNEFPIIERGSSIGVLAFNRFFISAQTFIDDYEFIKRNERRQTPKNPILDLFDKYHSIPGKWTPEVTELFMKRSIDHLLPIQRDPKSGIVKALISNEKFYNEEPNTSYRIAYRYLASLATRTFNGLKMSVCFNSLFGSVSTQEQFSDAAKWLASMLFSEGSRSWNMESNFLKMISDSDRFKDKKKEIIKRKQGGAFNKIMADLDFVMIDEKRYPRTHAAVHSGELPLGTFFRKEQETYFVYNDNWQLWEEMLEYHRTVAIEIASEASRRTTYEKDLMSYFNFVLHTLPEYLSRHTGRTWKGIPKLVKSANELDPPKEGENGVSKSRSALTPIANNDNATVTVPYVSMSIAGRMTTYCYGLDYNVLQRGFSFMGNAVTVDVEKELNGRDDYGLMFYTLTGSSQGRGYPTFLIIFERLTDNTRVHFHRTHPMRSKNGEYNPVHNWIKGCYKWMIGNVNFDRIMAQQGDLAFVLINEFPVPKEDPSVSFVNAYDGHTFGSPVAFVPYTRKDNQNVLGYVSLEKDQPLSHHEHLPRIIPAGSYEIRQCRSWEANPKGIWSLRID